MTEREALMRSIVEDPADDAARLVFADWLDENSDPDRAAYIRAEVERECLDPWDDRHAELKRRADELSYLCQHRWAAEVPLPATVRAREWRRGFPSAVVISRATPFTETWWAAAALLPLSEVDGLDTDEILDGFLASPYRDRVESMLITPRSSAGRDRRWRQCVRRLANGPVWPNLRRLSVHHFGVRIDDLRAVAHGRAFSAVRELVVETLDENPVAVLAGSPMGPRLTSITFPEDHIPADLSVLGESPAFAGLERLDICSRVDDETLTRLVTSPHLSRLASLNLGGNRLAELLPASPREAFHHSLRSLHCSGVRDRGSIRDWVRSGMPPGLRSLGLRSNGLAKGDLADWPADGPPLVALQLEDNDLGPRDIAALVSSPSLAGLRSLSLAGNRDALRGVVALSRSPHMRRLRELTLSSVGKAELRAFAEADWPELQSLSLDVTSPDVEALTRLGRASCPKLWHLSLDGTGIDAAALAALLAGPFTRNLESLSLRGCDLADNAVSFLAGWPGLRRLRNLDVRGNPFGRRGLDALIGTAELPLLKLMSWRGPVGDDLRSRFRAVHGEWAVIC